MSSSYSMAVMPKPKPNQVIRHEIVLSRPLQDTVDGLVGSQQFKNFADPSVRLLNDITGFATFLGIVSALGISGIVFDYVYGEERTPLEVFNNWALQRANALLKAGGLNDRSDLIPGSDGKASGPFEIMLAQIATIFT